MRACAAFWHNGQCIIIIPPAGVSEGIINPKVAFASFDLLFQFSLSSELYSTSESLTSSSKPVVNPLLFRL